MPGGAPGGEKVSAEKQIRVLSREEAERRVDLRDTTPAERVGMVWQLTLDAWTFLGRREEALQPMDRHYVVLRRSARDDDRRA